MRFIIYGAGAVGGVVGGHLARSGHDVVLIGRQGYVDAVNQHGLRLITPTAVYNVKPTAVTGPEQIKFTADDVVFTTMKGQSTEESIRHLKTQTNDVPIFCFQNGVRNEETVLRYFPRVFGVMVQCGSVYLTAGEVRARNDPPGWLVIGRYPQGTDALAEGVAAALRTASFLVKVSPDVMPYKWGKLMVNLSNAVEGITNAGADEKDNKRVIAAVRAEAKEILAQAAIRWVSGEQLAAEWPEITAKPRGTTPNSNEHGSTWQSIARGTGTIETEFLNGEIINIAKRSGKKAPINEALLSTIQEMAAKREPPGKYTPVQLAALMGLT